MKNAMKEFRKLHGLTLREAAEVLGYTGIRTLRYFEKGDKEISGQVKKAMQYYSELKAMTQDLEERLKDLN